METTRLAILIDRAMGNTLSPEEHDELLTYLADPRNKRDAEKLLTAAWDRFTPGQPVFAPGEGQEMLKRILDKQRVIELPEAGQKQRHAINYKLWAAASVLFVAMAAAYFFVNRDKSVAELTLAEAVTRYQIEPGKDQAVITLGDGRKIVLDEMGNGVIAEEAGMRINKSNDGQISYEPSSNDLTLPVTYNTIAIPKGGHFGLVLPDGTKVHLNAESTLKYPTRFADGDRVVELQGEAYFEVSHRKLTADKEIPFIVKTSTQEVEVLGTVFNINAYKDDAVKTTLVEGKVRVSNIAEMSALLQPGEAALLADKRGNFVVNKANLDLELAWYNGYFIFDDENIKSIMERVARWYDVEVEYQGDMTDKKFGGIFQRSKSMAQLLENFRETGLITFNIEGRRVIVMEK